MSSRRILITAGPTIEPLDPVRFFSNASSGKMGRALAVAFFESGFDVTVITSLRGLRLPVGVRRIFATSAAQMYASVREHFPVCDCLVMAAAVSDYRPLEVSSVKLKKSSRNLTLTLCPTVDILRWAGRNKCSSQFVVGFALEDTDLMVNAERKLVEKHLDLVIANSPSSIGSSRCRLCVKSRVGPWQSLPRSSKSVAARELVSIISRHLAALGTAGT